MPAAHYEPAPADSRDLPLYAVENLPRRFATAFSATMPPRECYSRQLPGVCFGEDDVLVLDQTPFAASGKTWRRNTIAWAPRASAQSKRPPQCMVPAHLFVALFSIPLWSALAVFAVSLIPLT